MTPRYRALHADRAAVEAELAAFVQHHEGQVAALNAEIAALRAARAVPEADPAGRVAIEAYELLAQRLHAAAFDDPDMGTREWERKLNAEWERARSLALRAAPPAESLTPGEQIARNDRDLFEFEPHARRTPAPTAPATPADPHNPDWYAGYSEGLQDGRRDAHEAHDWPEHDLCAPMADTAGPGSDGSGAPAPGEAAPKEDQ